MSQHCYFGHPQAPGGAHGARESVWKEDHKCMLGFGRNRAVSHQTCIGFLLPPTLKAGSSDSCVQVMTPIWYLGLGNQGKLATDYKPCINYPPVTNPLNSFKSPLGFLNLPKWTPEYLIPIKCWCSKICIHHIKVLIKALSWLQYYQCYFEGIN